MNKEQREKGLATKKAQAEAFAAQTIEIDDNWRIVRPDEYNWEIQRKNESGAWRFEGYYGKLVHAFQALPDKMLGSVAKTNLAHVYAQQKAINATIEAALNLKFAAGTA